MASMAPRRIAQIAIVVDDLERAKAFYRDVLGLAWIADAPPSLCFFQCGETRLMLSPPEGPETRGSSILYYDVEDVAAAHAEMAAKGVAFLQEPHVVGRLGDKEVSLAICRDSEGNMLGLMSERTA
jgi:predicted enzyme related to lactoylglutathione lyase